MNVVPLHDGRPSLCDMIGRLRLMADELEQLKDTDNDVRTLLIVTHTVSGEAKVACFGDVPSMQHCAGLLLTGATQLAAS